MIWTRFTEAAPPEPQRWQTGEFWYRRRKRGCTTIVTLFYGRDQDGRRVVSAAYEWAKQGFIGGVGWWAGPIPEPQEENDQA